MSLNWFIDLCVVSLFYVVPYFCLSCGLRCLFLVLPSLLSVVLLVFLMAVQVTYLCKAICNAVDVFYKYLFVILI